MIEETVVKVISMEKLIAIKDVRGITIAEFMTVKCNVRRFDFPK